MKKELIFLSSILISTHSFGATLQVISSKDNTLYESATGATSNGIGSFTFIGKTGPNDGINLRRTLTKFDVSAIPAGSTVNSVSVGFTISKAPPGAQPDSADLHLLLTDWGERTSDAPGNEGSGTAAEVGDATWLHTFFSTQFWSTIGGDFSPTSSANITYGVSNNEVIIFASNSNLVADVQLWVDTPADNFGWIIIGDETTVKNSRRLNSRESATGTPVLIIDYSYTVFSDGFETP